MPDVLIRGLSASTLDRIDAEAAALGLSRNEYLRRRLESDAPRVSSVPTTLDDLSRAAAASQDLLDPDVMEAAWR